MAHTIRPQLARMAGVTPTLVRRRLIPEMREDRYSELRSAATAGLPKVDMS
jgi:hypothetical protein